MMKFPFLHLQASITSRNLSRWAGRIIRQILIYSVFKPDRLLLFHRWKVDKNLVFKKVFRDVPVLLIEFTSPRTCERIKLDWVGGKTLLKPRYFIWTTNRNPRVSGLVHFRLIHFEIRIRIKICLSRLDFFLSRRVSDASFFYSLISGWIKR